MDWGQFFAAVRKPVFGGKMTQQQVDNVQRIVAYRDKNWPRMSDEELSYILAATYWETGHSLDAGAVEMGGSKKWYAPYYGRGLCQLTLKANYAKWDLADHPDRALDWDVALKVLFEGFIFGKFTGKKLADFIKPSGIDFVNARSIQNTMTDHERNVARMMARDAEAFLYGFRLARRSAENVPVQPRASAPPQPRLSTMGSIISMLIANPLTTMPGLALVLTNLGTVLTMLGGGANIGTIWTDPHFQALLAGFASVFAGRRAVRRAAAFNGSTTCLVASISMAAKRRSRAITESARSLTSSRVATRRSSSATRTRPAA